MQYQSWAVIKAQALEDFVVELTPAEEEGSGHSVSPEASLEAQPDTQAPRLGTQDNLVPRLGAQGILAPKSRHPDVHHDLQGPLSTTSLGSLRG